MPRRQLRRDDDVDPDDYLAGWVDTVRSIIVRLAGELVLAVPPAAWRGREHNGHVVSVGTAQAWFRAAVHRALPRPSEDAPTDTESQEVLR